MRVYPDTYETRYFNVYIRIFSFLFDSSYSYIEFTWLSSMTIIVAEYKGWDKLADYRTGQQYELIIKEYGFLESLFRRAGICIWRTENPQGGSGRLRYKDMSHFLYNWSILTQDEYELPPLMGMGRMN